LPNINGEGGIGANVELNLEKRLPGPKMKKWERT